jgi:DNA-binding Lrp family transcriptional regulator
MTGPYFGIIPRWVAPLDMHGADHRVLLVIACHARKGTRIAQISIEQIAGEVKLDRRNVQRAIRRLDARGVLKKLRGGGRLRGSQRGHASEYEIIFTPRADAKKSVGDTAASDADNTGNSVDGAAISSEETAAFSDLNSVACAAPTESEQKEDKTPPSGESHRRAREKGEDLSNDEVDEKPGVLCKGGGDRIAPVRRYNPSAALVDWAREQYGINALDDAVLGGFIDWHVEHDVLPGNGSFQAIEAGYRRWIRREPLFAKQARHRPQHHSNPGEAESEAAVDALRRMRAGHD